MNVLVLEYFGAEQCFQYSTKSVVSGGKSYLVGTLGFKSLRKYQ